MALWYGFCNNATTMNEFYNRCRYISLRLIDQLLSAQAHGLTQLNDETTTANDVSSPRRALWITQSFHMLVRNPPQQSFDALPLLAAPEYHPLAIFRALLNHLFPKYHLNCNPRIWYEKLLIDAIMICRVLYFFGQLFSIIFPFLHFIIYRGHQNLLQCFCFYGAAGTMFVIICLAPRIYRFVLFGLFHLPQAMLLSNKAGTQTIVGLIEDYFIPQPAHFIANEVDPELLPADLVGVVASFLRREDLDLRAITVEDCRNVSNNMIMSNLSIDVPCTGHHPRH